MEITQECRRYASDAMSFQVVVIRWVLRRIPPVTLIRKGEGTPEGRVLVDTSAVPKSITPEPTSDRR